MDPVVEQHDKFLMYIKNKFKLLSQDETISLLVEIHLKPYFDFKGGTIVGSAYNTCEAATSAFAFMVSNICSKYKDVVHIMPTKCLKAQSLFKILKEIIIGLEEIGFKVISVITDNNAINKNSHVIHLSTKTVNSICTFSFEVSASCPYILFCAHI